MRHGQKGCRRTDKEKLRGASRIQHKRERRGVCVYPSSAVRIRVCVSVLRALVGCKKKMVAKEFSPCDCFRPDLTNGTLTSTVNAFLSDAYTHVQACLLYTSDAADE